MPQFVLMHDGKRIGPNFVPAHAGASAIYGFSDKEPYDRFRQNSPLPLTPYPLVKTYLTAEAANAGDAIRLVVIDAAGPDDAVLHAATISNVLAAHENRSSRISTAYRLAFDSAANAYQCEASPE